VIAVEVAIVDYDEDICLVQVRGQLDLDSAQGLRDALDPLLATPSPRLIIDLSAVDFCDSTGLSALATAHTYSVARGGLVHLAGPSMFLHRILTTVGLAERIPIFATVSDAAGAMPPGEV
jgi:anti-anti-sigma factor